MARSRNLKPAFFKDARVVGCSFAARILFQGLWSLADYRGRLKYHPLEVKMEIFPADDVKVEELIEELSNTGLIDIYPDHSGTTLVHVINFEKHQNPHINEKQGKDKNPLPALPSREEVENLKLKLVNSKVDKNQVVSEAIKIIQEYYQSDPADSLNLIPSNLFPITDLPKSDTPAQPEESISQSTDTELKSENNQSNNSSSSKIAPCPHSEIIRVYHEILPELPRVIESLWPGSVREKNLKARWKQSPTHQSIDFWERFFTAIRKIDWYFPGQGSPQMQNFSASLGWIIKRENFDKAIETIANKNRKASCR